MTTQNSLLKAVTVFLIFAGFLLPLGAEEDFIHLIGMTPDVAVEYLGAPSEIYPVRGQREDQDEVVLYYPGKVYLFFLEQRVWQIRMDENSELFWEDIRTGVTRSEVAETLGAPYYSTEGWDIYLIPGGDWPLRLRIFYRENRATDFYLYRGDM